MTTDQIKAAVETVKGWLHAGWPDGRLRPAIETLITAAQETELLRDRIRFCEYFWAQEADLCWDITLVNEQLRARIAELENKGSYAGDAKTAVTFNDAKTSGE